jgi:hypothetical protein
MITTHLCRSKPGKREENPRRSGVEKEDEEVDITSVDNKIFLLHLCQVDVVGTVRILRTTSTSVLEKIDDIDKVDFFTILGLRSGKLHCKVLQPASVHCMIYVFLFDRTQVQDPTTTITTHNIEPSPLR